MNPITYYRMQQRSKTLELPYVNAPTLRLTLGAVSGSTFDVDWGDGTGIVTLNTGVAYTKSFSSSPGGINTGSVKIYQADRLSYIETIAAYPYWNFNLPVLSEATGLGRCYFHGNVGGSIDNISPLLYNIVISGTGNVTGTSANIPSTMVSLQLTSTNANFQSTDNLGVNAPLLQQLRVLGTSKHVGDIALLPSPIVIISLKNTGTPLHEVTYTAGRTWANNMREVEILPAVGFGLSTSEVDNLLIDLAAATWSPTQTKILNIAGNNAPRSILSDEAKASLEAQGVSVTVNEPVTYYVRPAGSTYGTGDGLSYTNAWAGYANVNMIALQGNRLVVNGTHTEAFSFDGVNFEMIGDDINGAGIFDAGLSISDMVTVQNATNFKARGITINNPNVTGLHFEDTNYYIESCYFDNSQNQGIQHYGICNGYLKDCEFTNNVDDGISGHETATFTVDGGLFDNNEAGINTIQNCNVTIINSPTFANNIYDIWAANATTPKSCKITATGCTFPNQVLASNKAQVVLNNCNATDVVIQTTTGNKSYLEANDTVIGNLNVSTSEAVLNQCRLNDITSISAGGLVDATECYIKPVGVFDVNGTLRAIRTLFDATDCTDHTIDCNSGSTLKLQYCVIKNTISGKYALSLRTGMTIENLEALTIFGSSVGRGIYSQLSTTIKNSIITETSQGVNSATTGQTVTLENCTLFNNTTPISGSGTVLQNDSVNNDPLFVDTVTDDYRLQVGSTLINAGEVLVQNNGFLNTIWGDFNTPPTITSQELNTFNIGAF